MVVRAGSIITAGGTTKRKEELATTAFGKLAYMYSKMLVYTGRFASCLIANRYRLLNFDNVKLWHTTGKTLGLAPANEKVAAEFNKQKVRTAAAYKEFHAQLCMAVVDAMYGDIPDLITAMSGNGDSVEPTILNRLAMQRAMLADYASDPTLTIQHACAAVGIIGKAAVDAAVKKFKPVAIASAKAAAAKWDKHFPQAITCLRRRFFYSPFVMPPPIPAGATHDFFGCYLADHTQSLRMNYVAFQQERRSHRERHPEQWEVIAIDTRLPLGAGAGNLAGTIPFVEYWEPEAVKKGEAEGDGSGLSEGDPCYMILKPEFRPAGGTGAYWRGKKTLWSSLHPTGSFWIEFELGGIAAERVYAIVRKMGLPGRGSMDHDTFRREIFFRVNREALLSLLAATRKDAAKM